MARSRICSTSSSLSSSAAWGGGTRRVYWGAEDEGLEKNVIWHMHAAFLMTEGTYGKHGGGGTMGVRSDLTRRSHATTDAVYLRGGAVCSSRVRHRHCPKSVDPSRPLPLPWQLPMPLSYPSAPVRPLPLRRCTRATGTLAAPAPPAPAQSLHQAGPHLRLLRPALQLVPLDVLGGPLQVLVRRNHQR